MSHHFFFGVLKKGNFEELRKGELELMCDAYNAYNFFFCQHIFLLISNQKQLINYIREIGTLEFDNT